MAQTLEGWCAVDDVSDYLDQLNDSMQVGPVPHPSERALLRACFIFTHAQFGRVLKLGLQRAVVEAIAKSIDHLGAAMLNGVTQPSSALIQNNSDKQQEGLLTLQVVVLSACACALTLLWPSCCAVQVLTGEVSFVPSIANEEGGVLDIVNGWVCSFCFFC